ncbi:MAG: Do family serine endopeptidase [Opitutales bacterium]
MRSRFFAIFLVLLVGVLGFKAYLDATDESQGTIAPREVVIRIDNTPVDTGSEVGPPTSYADILDSVRPAVVTIFSTKIVEQRSGFAPFRDFRDDPFFRRFFGIPEDEEEEERGGRAPRQHRQQGLGSGFVVNPDGYILTNNHVIEGADEIRVLLSDRREFDAELVGTDPQTDIAVLRIDAEDLPSVTFADSDNLRIGDILFALGNPLNVGQTVTMGIVSATGRSQINLLGDGGYENFIQTDAAINQGNSGGPLVDAKGRVIGINTAILSRTGGNIGIGFAIPVNMASNVMQSLIATGTVSRGFLGVNIQDLTPDLAAEFGVPGRGGALVANVVPDTPAAEAGLRQGDVIIQLNGQSIQSASHLRLSVSQMAPRSEATFVYVRNGEEESVTVILGAIEDTDRVPAAPVEEEEPEVEEIELLEGIKVTEITNQLREDFGIGDGVDGVLVIETQGTSRYAEDLPVGIVISQINQQSVSTIEEAQEALRSGRNVFLVNFRGNFRYLPLMVE